jgi:ribosomal protein S12
MSDVRRLSKADALRQIAKLEKQLARRNNKKKKDCDKAKAGSEKKGVTMASKVHVPSKQNSDARYRVLLRNSSSVVLISNSKDDMPDLHLLDVFQ